MKYHVSYKVHAHPEGLTREALETLPEERGAASGLLIGSIVYRDDGTDSVQFWSIDGRTRLPLDDSQIWKAWALLAHTLSESKTLAGGSRELCSMVHDLVSHALKSARAEADRPPASTSGGNDDG